MFQGNIYFPLPLNVAVDLFTDFDAAVANGLYTNPQGGAELIAFDSEKAAVAAGRQLYAADAAVMPGTRVPVPVFAVVHIGPIAPMAFHDVSRPSEAQVGGETATVFAPDTVERIARIVRNGAFAWNAVNMSMKVFTL
jgi:hypothetical protein